MYICVFMCVCVCVCVCVCARARVCVCEVCVNWVLSRAALLQSSNNHFLSSCE